MIHLCGVRLYSGLPEIVALSIRSPEVIRRLLFGNACMNVHDKDLMAHDHLLEDFSSTQNNHSNQAAQSSA